MRTKMKPEIKAAWIQALRSGDYVQSQGHLANSSGHCCLGVLCELAVKAGIVTKIDGANAYFESVENPSDNDNCYLPLVVQAWSGLGSRNPYIAFIGGDSTLGGINDSGDADFNGIANLVEEQL